MSEPTEPTPVTPPTPPAEPAADAAPNDAGAGATTGDAAAPPPPPPTGAATPAKPSIGRNLAIGIAVAALVIGGLIGAVGAKVLDHDGGRDGGRFGAGRGDQMGPGMPGKGDRYGEGERPTGPMGPMGPRGVDPDGDDQLPGDQGVPPSAPTMPTTTPAAAGA